ncbi:MAG TPA: HTH domain-containing protein [Clostridiales bacterium]|jgi:biotin operon repressor|nr:HTH domain-containing protein [Clostridiales bacterium]
MGDYCQICHKKLERDEIAIYLKLVNRGAKEYLCIPCLADYFKCSQEVIHSRIKDLKEMGCTLFG